MVRSSPKDRLNKGERTMSTTDRPIAVGDRVSVRGSIPAAYGRPVAEVVTLGPVCAKVRLFLDGSEWRIPYEELRLTAGQRWIDENPEAAVEAGLVDAPEVDPSTLATDDGSGPVVVISCGGAKADEVSPASELYVGTYFRAALRAALTLTSEDRVLVLSARYGFVRLSDRLAPYEQRIDRPGAIGAGALAATARRHRIPAGAEVVLLTPKAYAARAREVWPEARSLLDGTSGIGEQMARFSAIARGAGAEVEEVAA